MKYYIITTDDQGRTILYDYDEDLVFFSAVENLLSVGKPILAIKGIKILDVTKKE